MWYYAIGAVVAILFAVLCVFVKVIREEIQDWMDDDFNPLSNPAIAGFVALFVLGLITIAWPIVLLVAIVTYPMYKFKHYKRED